jgi:importin subunit alpha-6/7
VLDSGVLPRLVAIMGLDESNPRGSFEACWCVTNVASGDSHFTRAVVEAGAIPVLVDLCSSDVLDTRDQAGWCLGNIAGDSTEHRDACIAAGAIEALDSCLSSFSAESSSLPMMRNATWALTNLVRGKPAPPLSVTAVVIPTLVQLLGTRDKEIIVDALWGLSYLSDGENERIQALLEAGAAPPVVELLGMEEANILVPALRTAGNIVTGNDAQTAVMLRAGALPRFVHLLASSRKGVAKEACWSLSNITAGNREQIQAVIDSGAIAPLCGLATGAAAEIRKEACWALSNLCAGGDASQMTFAVEAGILGALTSILSEISDASVLRVALEGLEQLLRSGAVSVELLDETGTLGALEALQDHANEAVYSSAVRILEASGAGEECDVNAADGGFVGGLPDAADSGSEDEAQGFVFSSNPPDAGDESDEDD